MSKSIGNVVDPMEIINKYGSDTARLFILFAALPEKELDWSDKGVEGSFRFLKRVSRLVEGNVEGKHSKLTNKEKRIIGSLHSTIKKVTDYLDKFQLSLAIGAMMEFTNDLYKYKAGEINKEVYDECCKSLALMLAPFAPHLAEEMWELLGEKGFISLAKWPKYDEKKIDKKADALEGMLHNTISDIKSVQELTKIKEPKKITLILASGWKYEFFKQMGKQLEKTFNTGNIIKGIMADEKLKKHGAVIAKLIPKLVKEPARIPEMVLDQKTETQNFEDNKKFFETEFKTKVEITTEDKSKDKKAGSAMPAKPAIILE
jgi:leucyl-tRNA synthetase